MQSVTDDLGRGLGPIIVAAFITSLGGRRNAFNLSISGWIPCGLITLALACFLRRDEAAVQARLKARSDAARRARALSLSSVEAGAALADALAEEMGLDQDGGGRAPAGKLGIELEPCGASGSGTSGGGASGSGSGSTTAGAGPPLRLSAGCAGCAGAGGQPWRASDESGASGSGRGSSGGGSAADSRTQLLQPRDHAGADAV
jgi:hypothetical protein